MERLSLSGNCKTMFSHFEMVRYVFCSGSAFYVFIYQLLCKKGTHIGQCSSPLHHLRSLACLFETHVYDKMEMVVSATGQNRERHFANLETFFYCSLMPYRLT